MRRALFAVVVALGVAACGSSSRSKTSNVTGTTAVPLFVANFANPASPIVNTTGSAPGSVQAANWGFAPTYFHGRGKYFANYFPARGGAANPPLSGVTNYGDYQMTVPPAHGCPNSAGMPNQIACHFEAITTPQADIKSTEQGNTTYQSLAVYVPASGRFNVPASGWELQDNEFTNIFNGAAIRWGLFSNSLVLWMDSGQCETASSLKPGCDLHTQNNPGAGWPTRATIRLPVKYMVPPGRFAANAGHWEDVVLAVKWEYNATGTVRAWYKGQSDSSWTQSLHLSGIPTMQQADSECSCKTAPDMFVDGPMVYGEPAQASTAGHFYLAGSAYGTSMASVTPYLP